MSEEDRFEADEQPPQEDDVEIRPDEPENAADATPALWRGSNPRRGGVRALAEGAMMTAVTLILAVISMYVPILNFLAQLLFPAPLALLVLRHGLRSGCIGAVSVFLLSTMLLGLPQAIYLFILYGFLGLFFGWCFRTRKKASFTLLTGVLLASAAMLLMLLFPTYILGISPEQYQEMLAAMIHDYALVLEQQGSTAMMGGMNAAAYTEYMLARSMRLLPGMLIVMAMGLTWACYLLLARLLRRLNYEITKLPPFREWRMDWRLLWVLIAALAASSLGDHLQLDLLAQVANNALVVFGIVFAACGLAVLLWAGRRFKISPFIQVLALLFILQVFSWLALTAVGVFDPLFDFRQRLERYAKKRDN